MTGAAYASSSANAPPSSTFPATIASFGFIHQPNTVGSHDSATLPASDGLTAGRGCPVGDAAADRSPTLLPTSPEQQDELQETMSTPHPSHFQASSTPMVRQVSKTILLCGFLVWKMILYCFKAGLAQLLEHLTAERKVAGSIPEPRANTQGLKMMEK